MEKNFCGLSTVKAEISSKTTLMTARVILKTGVKFILIRSSIDRLLTRQTAQLKSKRRENIQVVSAIASLGSGRKLQVQVQ